MLLEGGDHGGASRSERQPMPNLPVEARSAGTARSSPGAHLQLKRATLPDRWNCTHLRDSDLVLSIGNAAINHEMSLHQMVAISCVLRRYRRYHNDCGYEDIRRNTRSLAVDEADEGATGRHSDCRQYTKGQCFIKTLELNDQHADAWNWLGHAIVEAATWAGSSTLISSTRGKRENSDRLLDYHAIDSTQYYVGCVVKTDL